MSGEEVHRTEGLEGGEVPTSKLLNHNNIINSIQRNPESILVKMINDIIIWSVNKYHTVKYCWIANILESIMTTAHN